MVYPPPMALNNCNKNLFADFKRDKDKRFKNTIQMLLILPILKVVVTKNFTYIISHNYFKVL